MVKWRVRRSGFDFSRLAQRAVPLTLPTVVILGVALAVRHYATQALPSHRRPVTPAEQMQAPPAAAVRQQRHELRPRRPLPGKQAPGAKRPLPATAAKTAGGQRSNQGDDDYVAPDTYVYYGQKGKATR